ncbi:MAG: hypothetical protein ABI790_05405 [Betaproteobacteria bacterium]
MLKGLASRLRAVVTLVISATQAGQYNLFTAAGSPANAVDIYLTINTAVVLQAGLIGTGFAAGSTITIVNNGRIAGAAGFGANGVGLDGSSNYLAGIAPGNGAHAIETNAPTRIDNTNGEIFGGGGGGGAGAANRLPVGGPYTYRAGGGGGGGGRGYNNAAAGAGGVSAVSVFESGFAGTAGSSSAVGVGGPCNTNAGAGGGGGDWGLAGEGGAVAAQEGSNNYAGGVAGQAVKTNGGGVTWLGGNNSGQVKGIAA